MAAHQNGHGPGKPLGHGLVANGLMRQHREMAGAHRAGALFLGGGHAGRAELPHGRDHRVQILQPGYAQRVVVVLKAPCHGTSGMAKACARRDRPAVEKGQARSV